jgi:hypothetical protein
MPHRPLSDIAREIQKDWSKDGTKPIYFGAVPYLQAMRTMSHVAEDYGDDEGRSIVIYFLANANTWKGETARRIKKELKEMVK